MTGVGDAATDATSRETVVRIVKSIVDDGGGEGWRGGGQARVSLRGGGFEIFEAGLYTSNTGTN